MLALILNIVFSSAFILLIKWAQVRETEDEITFGAINYIVAAIAILPFFLLYQPEKISTGAIWAGASMGLIYFLTYFLVIFAMRKIGAASTTVVSVMSILVPIFFAAIYYREMPTGLQMAGIALALVSLILVGLRFDDDSSIEKAKVDSSAEQANATHDWRTSIFDSDLWVPLILFLFFLLCGLSRIAQEAFKHLVELDQQPAQRATFGVAAFVTAATPSILVLIFRKKKIRASEFGFGFAMGISNILQTLLILAALQQYKGFIVFPVTSAGGVVLIALVASAILGEKLSRGTVVGISISVVAVFLLQ